MTRQDAGEEAKVEILSIPALPGGAMREIAYGLLLILRGLDFGVRARAIVLDTNVILKDLGFACRKRRKTTLVEEADLGFARLLVTPSVAREVPRVIPEYAENQGIDPSLMLAVWSKYRERLVVVNSGKTSSERLKQLEKRDPDDLDTGRLVELVGPALSLSSDNDLRDLGLANRGDWLLWVLTARTAIDGDAFEVMVKAGGTVIIIGFGKALEWAFRSLISAMKRVSPVTLATIGTVVGILLSNPRSQNWIRSRVADAASQIREGAPNARERVAAFISTVTDLSVTWRQAAAAISAQEMPSTLPSSLRGYAVRVLAHTVAPLPAKTILERAEMLGYKPRGEEPSRYLRQVLRADPVFRQDSDGYWSLSVGMSPTRPA